jgi:acyl-coenzyme A synthetase/AMP-(fatty) acid ligase
MNITEPIWRQCQSEPQKISMVSDGESTTYKQLLEQVLLVSARLSQTGVKKGDRVCVGLQSPAKLIIVVLALARMGAVVSLFKNFWPLDRKRMILRCHKTQYLVHQSGAEWTQDAFPNFKNVDVAEIFQASSTDETLKVPQMACDVDDLPWWLGISSGSPGRLRFIEKTHRRDAMSVALSGNRSVDKSARIMVYGDVTSLGFSMLRCLSAGGTLILTCSSAPSQFFDVVERDCPTQVVTSIGIASSLVKFSESQSSETRKRCKSLQNIALLGGNVTSSFLESVQHHICHQIEIKYGSTEVGLMTSMDHETAKKYPDVQGKLLPWVEAQAVDEGGQILPDGHKGLLRFRTPLLIDGYLDDEPASAKAFRDGWFYPGNNGSVDNAGFLRLDIQVKQSKKPESTIVNQLESEILSDTQLTVLRSTAELSETNQCIFAESTLIQNSTSYVQLPILKTVNVIDVEIQKNITPPFVKKLPFFPENRHGMLTSEFRNASSLADSPIKTVQRVNRDYSETQKKSIFRVYVHEWGYKIDREIPMLWVLPLSEANQYFVRRISGPAHRKI